MIRTVVQWSNGEVTAFDEHGRSIEWLSGPRKWAKTQLEKEDLRLTIYRIGTWPLGTLPMTRDQFFNHNWGDT